MTALALRPRALAAQRSIGWLLVAVILGGALGAGAGAQPKLAVAAVLLPGLVVLVVRPDWLPAALLTTAFGEAIGSGNITLSRVGGPLAILIMIVALPGRRPARLPKLGVAFAVLAYALWALASALWTVNPDSSMQLGGTGYALSSLGLSIAYMLAIASFVQTERDVRRLLVMIWVLAVITGIVSIAQYMSGYTRSLGLAGDANFFAALQVVALPFQAVLANGVRRSSTRIVVWIGLAITVGSIITSLSRGGILALAAVFVMLLLQPARSFFRSPAQKRAFVAVVLIGAGVLVWTSYGALSARTASLFHTSDGGSGRTNLWRAALAGWRQHPAYGMGFGAFIGQSNKLLVATPGVDFSAYALRPTGQYVHNAYLESLTELGVVGVGLFLVVLGGMARSLLSTARGAARNGAVFLAGFARAALLSVAGFAFTSLFLSTETDRTLWILVGISLALPRVVLNERREQTMTRADG